MSDELHLMIDIETLGTRPGAAILSIGAVVFAPYDRNGLLIRDRFYRGIELGSALRHGAVDAETLRWWLDQPVAVLSGAFSGTAMTADVLSGLAIWWAAKCPVGTPVWANGPAFDLVLIEDLCRRVTGRGAPWGFREHRCCRTLKAIATEAPVPERIGVEHHALADAEHQAVCVAARLRWLREREVGEAAARHLLDLERERSSRISLELDELRSTVRARPTSDMAGED